MILTINSFENQFKGFPTKIETLPELIDVVKRIVFIPVQHHAVNYPVAYYGGFVPNLPTKLYDDPRVPPQQFGFDKLPQYHVAAVRISPSITLGKHFSFNITAIQLKHKQEQQNTFIFKSPPPC